MGPTEELETGGTEEKYGTNRGSRRERGPGVSRGAQARGNRGDRARSRERPSSQLINIK